MARKPKTDPVERPNEAVPGEEIRQFIEQWEALEADKQGIVSDQKEVMAEAKSRGYDTKVLRRIIALRKRDKDDVAEEEAVLELYLRAMGMNYGAASAIASDEDAGVI